MTAILSTSRDTIYPDSDGQPMADSTKQFRWTVTIKENLEILFAEQPDVFVSGTLLWYPVEGDNTLRLAHDAMELKGDCCQGNKLVAIDEMNGWVSPHLTIRFVLNEVQSSY